MAVARIGPDNGGGLVGADGTDILGTKEDLELAAAAPTLLAACEQALRWIEGVLGGGGVGDVGLVADHPKRLLQNAIRRARGELP